MMRIIEHLDEMTETARGWLTGGTVGFVPIMNNLGLHEGHRILIEAANQTCEISVISILDNPLLPASNDTTNQQSKLARNLQFLNSTNVDVVFIPRTEDLYPPNFSTYVTPVGILAKQIEEMSGTPMMELLRDFTTVIAKLLQLVRPDVAFFVQYDAPEIALTRQLIRDLNIDVNLRVVPTAREHNGMAMSGQNLRRPWPERHTAAQLYHALLAGKALIDQGERDATVIEHAIAASLTNVPLVQFEQIVICHPDTFAPMQVLKPPALLSIRAQIAASYATDNILWLPDGQWRT
jgi:pantoate--beta-alanine ligase